MRVAIYSRVSTEDQNVKQQSRYLRKWCKDNDYEVVKAILDRESGTLPLAKRHAFHKLIRFSDISSCPYDAIVVQNIDRLTRNWSDELFIEQTFNIDTALRLISTSDHIDLTSASGRAMFRMKMIMSCFMPEDMKERQKIGIDRAKRQGKYKGRQKGSTNRVTKND